VDLKLEAIGTPQPPVIADRLLTPRDRRVRAQFAREHADQMRVTRETLVIRTERPGTST